MDINNSLYGQSDIQNKCGKIKFLVNIVGATC